MMRLVEKDLDLDEASSSFIRDKGNDKAASIRDEGEFLAQEAKGARQKLIQLGLDGKANEELMESNDEIPEITQIIDESNIDLDDYTVSNEMVINDADSLNDLLDSVDNTLQKAQQATKTTEARDP